MSAVLDILEASVKLVSNRFNSVLPGMANKSSYGHYNMNIQTCESSILAIFLILYSEMKNALSPLCDLIELSLRLYL